MTALQSGGIALRPARPEDAAGPSRILALPVARGLGIGGQIMAAILQTAREIGHDGPTPPSLPATAGFCGRLGVAAGGSTSTARTARS